MIRSVLRTGLLLAAVIGPAGCLTGSGPMGPALTVPEPPPRVVSSYPAEPDPEPVTETERDVPDDGRFPPLTVLGRPADRPLPPRATPSASPDDGEPADEREDTGEEPEVLQLASPTDVDLDAPTVRQTLDETTARLGAIDRGSLNSSGRAQYDTARRFLQQARAALATENLAFAYFLGEKALTLAEGL